MIPRPEGRQPIPPHAKKVFEGEIFDVYQWEQELFDGSKATFEKLKRQDTVTVLATTKDKKILLITEEQPGRSAVLSFPGGRADDGEDPEAAVRRELLEETGYTAETFTLYKAYQPVSKLDWAFYVFIARNAVKTAEPHLDAGERISVKEVTLDEVLDVIREPHFLGQEVILELLEAKCDVGAREKLETLLFG